MTPTNVKRIGGYVLGASALCAVTASGCDPQNGKFDGEFNAGGIDPYNFPPPFRGVGQVRQTPASGVFTEIAAFASGHAVGFYSFPFSPSQVQTTNYAAPNAAIWPDGVVDPLRVEGPGTNFRASLNNPVPVPLVYNFDPPGGLVPFPASAACSAPADWSPDPFYDAYPKDQQWNIFTFPPDRFSSFPFGSLASWSYRPIVAEVAVHTNGATCQDVKSERTLLSQADQGNYDMKRAEPEADPKVGRLGLPETDRFLAWALIDPGAAVYRVGQTGDVLQGGKQNGTTVQKYGWYGQFIVQYIDGGYIPVEDGPRIGGSPTKRMRPQRLYYPRSTITRTGAASPTPGAFGQGYDVMQADRFTNGAAYSPVCELWTYSLPAGTKQSDLPKDEATIIRLANSTLEPARTTQSATAYTPSTTIIPKYVFCLQAAPRQTAP